MPEQTSAGGLLGYQIRQQLYPGENDYFKKNPTVAGMASESGHIILNPFSALGVNRDAVARNEALRLHMRDNSATPQFDLTPEQRASFQGTAYGNDDAALRQTLAARIYSGDPSANATDQQRQWVNNYLSGIQSSQPSSPMLGINQR